MKKLLAVLLTLLTLCSCSEVKRREAQESIDNENIPATDEYFDDGVLNGLDYQLSSENKPLYDNVDIIKNDASGEAQSYSELIETLAETSRPFNFVKIKITEKYSPEDAYAITNNELFQNNATLFKAVVTYDFLNEADVETEINLAQSGSEYEQNEGKPLYSVGEEYCVYLFESKEEGWWIASQLCFAVHNVGGVSLAYQMSGDNLKLESEYVNLSDYANLNLEMTESEKSVITSTENNPAIYSYKMTEKDLVKFIKDDWTSRGYEFGTVK